MAEWFGLGIFHEPIWVLRNVSFNVAKGQAVGIVGVNGAGKSTLLKIITGTTMPTTGTLRLGGRISALLELGMGFHPDFTGSQNCFMSGQLHGLKSNEIETLIPEIAEFAEIGDYFDQPVRTYSSGMQVRLAFSLATAKRPEILIVDEALSVGDTYFQHKSFERIRQFREAGTTLLFVSHDRSAVQSLCDRAILLESGAVIKDSEPEEVMDFYNAMIANLKNVKINQNKNNNGRIETRSGTQDVIIENVLLLNESQKPIEYVNTGEMITIAVHTLVKNSVGQLTAGYMIRDRLGQSVFGTNTFHLGKSIQKVFPGEQIQFMFRFPANLGTGSYSVSVALHAADSHLVKSYDWWDLALVFNVINSSHEQFVGVAWIPPQVECLR
jgi:lipopolysaccharide transport system ATP-binding protein